MAIHIIIDGYNLIRQSPSLLSAEQRGLQQGREALINKLAAYRKIKGYPVTVVFDGTHAPVTADRRVRVQGIDICFSPPGKTADAVIKQMAARERAKALVVSSDNAVAGFAEAQGAAAISAEAFDLKLTLAGSMAALDDTDNDAGGWKPTTRKKGPSRRLSRRQRRRGLKMEKL